MKKRDKLSVAWIMIYAILFTIVSFPKPIYAQKRVVCNEVVHRNNVIITGKVEGINEKCTVTILVGNDDDYFHIDQIDTDANGEFVFEFYLPKNFKTGTYKYEIGNTAGAEKYEGQFEYDSGEIEELDQFVRADISINISGYVPTIEGTIESINNITTTLNILNETSQTTIANDVITSNENVYSFSYSLPSLLKLTEYTVKLTCCDKQKVLADTSITIDSSILNIGIEGLINIAENALIDTSIESTNTDILDTTMRIEEDKAFTTSIPNIAAYASFDLILQGYVKEYVFPSVPDVPSVIRTLSGKANDVVNIAVSSRAASSFAGRTFKLEYNPQQLQLISIFDNDYSDIIVQNNKDDVEIISKKDGEIIFRVYTQINGARKWSGIINLFKFRFLPNYSGSTTITLK